MPLRKPKDLPQLPNTRKKSIEEFKNTIPAPKPDKIEYIIYFYFDYDHIQKKHYLAIKLESSISFSAFNYEISTDIFRKSNLIEVGILGLTTKINNAPLETKATTVIKLPDEVGEISVNIIKYDGCENSCNIKFNLYEKNIQILNTQVVEKQNNRLFCKFEVNPKLNNFSNELLGE
jgi:hypothetical protein